MLAVTLGSTNMFADDIDTRTNEAVPKAEFKGKGENLETLFANSTTEVTKLYLYNVGDDRFLNAGGEWGTQTVVFTVGLPITVTQTTTKVNNQSVTVYMMSTSFDTKGGATTGTHLGDATGKGTNDLFWDRQDKESYWIFTRVTTGFDSDEYVYTLQNTNTSNYMYAGGTILTSVLGDNTIKTSVNHGETNPTAQSTDAAKKLGYWKVITQQELIANFDNTYDNVSQPSDATFLVRGQNFNRNNTFSKPATTGTMSPDAGWFNLSNMNYANNANSVSFTSGASGDSNTYGMFYCGYISSGSAGNELVQKVTLPKKGWYRLDCEGFYHNDTNQNTPLAELFARLSTETTRPSAPTSKYAYMNLVSKESMETPNGSTETLTNGTIDNMKEAGQAFYYNYYPHSIMIHASADNTDIELGLRVLQDLADGDYFCFDDFELKFLGEEVVLSENDENINAQSDQTNYKNRLLLFERKMTVGEWATITMPFDVNKQQILTTFGPETKVAYFDGFEDNTTLQFFTIDMTKKLSTDIVMKKDSCYLIKVSKPCYEESYQALTDKQTTTITYYYTMQRVSLNKSTLATEISTRTNSGRTNGTHKGKEFTHPGGKDCQVSFCGTYVKTKAPVNSYVFSGGKMYFLSSDMEVKGYRGWIEDAHQSGNANAQRHKFGLSLSGVSDEETTAIAETLIPDTTPVATDAVYDLSGRAVRTGNASLEGLPKGLYIMGGKKYVVR